jgi:hypothetical protein
MILGAVLIELLIVMAVVSVIAVTLWAWFSGKPPPPPPPPAVMKIVGGLATQVPPTVGPTGVGLSYVVGVSMPTPQGTQGPTIPEQGAQVTFEVVTGNATVNGQTTVTVTTDVNGEATARLVGVHDGWDTLEMKVSARGQTQTDTERPRFETTH